MLPVRPWPYVRVKVKGRLIFVYGKCLQVIQAFYKHFTSMFTVMLVQYTDTLR